MTTLKESQVKLTQREKAQITQTVSEIKDILEEASANPDGYDLLKTSVEIYNKVLGSLREDLEIVDNMKSYWANLNAGSEK